MVEAMLSADMTLHGVQSSVPSFAVQLSTPTRARVNDESKKGSLPCVSSVAALVIPEPSAVAPPQPAFVLIAILIQRCEMRSQTVATGLVDVVVVFCFPQFCGFGRKKNIEIQIPWLFILFKITIFNLLRSIQFLNSVP